MGNILLRLFMVIASGVSLFVSPFLVVAGTQGGLYNMEMMLVEPHPFAAPGHSKIPTVQSPGYGMVPIAPPSPTLRYTPLPLSIKEEDGVVYDNSWRLFDNQWMEHFYFSVGFGPSLQKDLEVRTISDISRRIDLDSGLVGQVAIGTHFAGQWRLDIEAAYRNFHYNKATTGNTTVAADGDLQITSGIVNLFYDIPFGHSFAPYFGGGLGLAHLKSGDSEVEGILARGRDSIEVAFQGIGGIAFKLNNYWAMGADARYFRTIDEGVSNTAFVLNFRRNLQSKPVYFSFLN